PVYGRWGRGAGAPPGRRQRRSGLHLHASVVGRHHGYQTLAAGTAGEAGGIGPPTARPPGALWGLPRATQPPTRERHPHTAPAGNGGTGGHDHGAALELGTAAASGVCTSTAWRKKDPLLCMPFLGYHDSRRSDYPAPAWRSWLCVAPSLLSCHSQKRSATHCTR